MPDKKKVLLFSFAPPENHGGIRVLLYRHFRLINDFDFKLVTDAEFATEDIPHLRVGLGRILNRLKKTRFHRWVVDWQNLVWPNQIPPSVHYLVKSYKPDVVFTIPDNSLSWMAVRVAQHYRLPLVSFFMDWVPVMDDHIGHKFTAPLLDNRFRKIHRLSRVSIGICQGMLDELGPHPDARVIYPIPATRDYPTARPKPSSTDRTSILYIGNTQAFYGKILERLFLESQNWPDVDLKIVGPPPRWNGAVLDSAKRRGVYLGYKNSDEVSDLCSAADFLLVVMSFENNERLFTETCFPTKVSDYTAWGKPLLVWAPTYASPFQLKMTGPCFLRIEENNPSLVFKKAIDTKRNQRGWVDFAWAALKAREVRFHPALLQEKFREALERAATP